MHSHVRTNAFLLPALDAQVFDSSTQRVD
jgi:hypothetical protein